ncbi:DNA-directed RNA polymerase subunit alpha C-terminal domain-containing protein [Anaerosporobacter sp.]|uniref:DNA-directed RNA polymerase subunit alpha C-terminal domain-containing protein n=1 Tax=Anaerosporobacter sp. TaxID=1872529 RepID=UPI00286EE338|nr:DNA-directed RNA polymerase subunit alpha C-terminal domain-containing protein [Anaerosporobacter sp.]
MIELKAKVSVLEFKDMTLTEFRQAYSNEKIEEDFVFDMDKKGYLCPEKGDVLIRDIQISTRLRNALARNGILLISQLGNYPKERYLKMRNIGEESYKELKEICKKYEVKIPTLEVLEKDLLPVSFSSRQLLELYEINIHSAKDIEKFSMEELEMEYRYDRRMYNSVCRVIEVKRLNVEGYEDR